MSVASLTFIAPQLSTERGLTNPKGVGSGLLTMTLLI